MNRTEKELTPIARARLAYKAIAAQGIAPTTASLMRIVPGLRRKEANEVIDQRGITPLGERGQGPKTLDPNGEVMKVHHVRTTDAQWQRYHAKGGAVGFRAWLES